MSNNASRSTRAQAPRARKVTARRAVLSVLLPISVVSLALAAPVLAAPEWGITMEHHNAYGAQRAECPGGHESLPG